MVKAYSATAVSGGTVAGAGSFDIGIKRTSGAVVGMMLRRSANEVPAYQVFDDEYLASQFFTGEPGYGNLPSEKEIAIIQNDWRSGFGLEVYDASDSKRYRTSNGMDMRFRGMGIAGPIATAIALPGTITPTFANLDMELNANWTNGTRSNTFAHGGTYSWRLASTDVGTPAYQDASNWSNAWRSRLFIITGWIKTSATTTARINIDDGIGETNGTTQTAGVDWTKYTIVRTLDAAATRLRIELEIVSSSGNPVYFDDITVYSPAMGAPITGVDFNDLHYLAMGNSLVKLNGSGNGFTDVYVFPATITDLEVMTISGTEYLFIAIGLSNAYWYMVAAETLTESTAAVTNFKYFKVVDAAAPTMWGSDGVNTIRSTVNPLNGGTAWSGQTTIAGSSDTITGLFTDTGSLYINKEDMPYYLNSSGAVKNDLAPELATTARSTDNGKGAFWWLHNFYLPYGSSLLESDGGVNTWRSPNDFSTQLADFVGQIFAVAGDDHYLFAIVDNSTKIEVLAGRSEVVDGTTQWVWHPINETTLTGCEACWVSSVYQKRLWIGSTSSSDSIYYIPLPVAYGNVLADANRSFLTATTMETSWLHGNFRSTVKAYIKLTLELGHTYNAGVYFSVSYKKLEDSGWTSIGNYTGSSTSMIQSRYIPVDGSSNNPKSTLFKLQFTAVTNDVQKTPVLLNYQLKAVLYPDQREIIAMKVYCANDILLRDGGRDSESYDTIIATLDEARTATYPVTIYDISGVVLTGKFLPLPSGVPRWKLIANEANRRTPEREYALLFQVIPVA